MATLLIFSLLLSSSLLAYADEYSSAPASAPVSAPASAPVSAPVSAPGPVSGDIPDAPAPPMAPTETYIPENANQKVLVIIEGVVLCQDCNTRGTWALTDSKAIKGAKIGITCRDSKNRPAGYQAVDTDDNGYFWASFDVALVSDYFSGDPTKACFARLLSSPNSSCNDLTNINYGIVGGPIRYEGKKFCGTDYDTVVYASGPLSFRPHICAPTYQY